MNYIVCCILPESESPKNTSVTEMYVGYSMFLRKRMDF